MALITQKSTEGYKITEVGVIPKDWRVVLIEEIAEVKGGKRLPKGEVLSDLPTPHPYIKVSDMFEGGVRLNEMQYVPKDVFPKIRNYRIYKNDLFISVAGTLGIVGEIPSKLDGANLTENADRLTNIKCHKKYLLYLLKARIVQNAIELARTLGAQPKLALSRIKKFSIPLPSTIKEQASIATVLSDADSLIENLEKLIAKKRAIKKGAMQQLLTGKRRFPGFGKRKKFKQTEIGEIPDDWEVLSLGEAATLKARIGWQGLTTAEYKSSGDYYLITGTEFIDGKIDWGECHFVEKRRYGQDKNIQVKENDVLITKDGTIGKVAFINQVPKPATLNSGIFVIRPYKNEFHPQFLYYILSSSVFNNFLSQLSAGSTINHLYQKDFVNFSFQKPPILEEQIAIAEVLSDMDQEIEILESKLSKYHKIKTGMTQQLLTGKIRIYEPKN